MNQVNLVGNVGQNPELRYTNTGIPVCDFSMAVNERWTGGDGNMNERTIWCRITTWNGLAETIAQYLIKGRQVRVTGKLGELRPWIDHDGNARCTQEVTANEVQFLGAANSMSNQQHAYEPETANQARAQTSRRPATAQAPDLAPAQASTDDDSEADHEDQSNEHANEYADLAQNNQADELEAISVEEANQSADESDDASTDENPAEATADVSIQKQIKADQTNLPPRVSADQIKAATDNKKPEVLLSNEDEEPLVEYVDHSDEQEANSPLSYFDQAAEEEDDPSHVSQEPVEEPVEKSKPKRKAKSKTTPTGADAVAMLASANGVSPGSHVDDDDDLPF